MDGADEAIGAVTTVCDGDVRVMLTATTKATSNRSAIAAIAPRDTRICVGYRLVRGTMAPLSGGVTPERLVT